MQKQDRNQNLLRPNARNQRQQIESRRDIKDRRVGDEVENNYPIKNLGHLFLLHEAVGGGSSFFRTFAVETRAQVRRVPVPPIMFSVRLLVVAVMLLRFAEQIRKCSDVDLSRWRRLPFAAGKACRDLLPQPAVPVWILKRGKREVGTTFRVAPSDARVLDRVVEGAAGVVEDLADVDAAGDQAVAGGVDVIHGEDQFRRASPGRRDSLAENDRRLRTRRSKLYTSKVFIDDVYI